MKFNSFSCVRQGLLILLPLLALVLGGCSIFSGSGTKFDSQDLPTEAKIPGEEHVARLHVGDTVTITLSGPPEILEPQEKPIKEDGTITLRDIGRVQAAGKTPGALEDAIHSLYVPKVYKHLSVTVKTSNDRVYYVRGEVKRPDRILYTGSVTVSKAITAAGDFTDFADRSSVILTRANGKRFELNLKRILAGKDPDPLVYPGDQIEVGRRIF